MIWINFVRDLKSTASRLVSVAIITCIAVLVYTGLNGILYNIDSISNGYFDRQNVADYWITGVGLSQGDCRALQKLPGVTGVQPRIVYEAEPRGLSGVVVQLYAVGDFEINRPYLVEGRLPASNRELLMSDAFADVQGFRVGDMVELPWRIRTRPWAYRCAAWPKTRSACIMWIKRPPRPIIQNTALRI